MQRARATADRLAAEAAEMTEEGIRDLVDEDAEVDAAVRAALVRQTSDRAMHAGRRAAQLESLGSALAFGHVTDADGERLAIGRHSVIDGDDALLVDWRARAAIPFYRATAVEPLGVVARRHLHYGEGDADPEELTGWSDEVFDPGRLDSADGLRGEAAILASLDAPTTEQMQSVVATIQAEQDAVIRASARGPLVVQGGPGTGKTVVALHRAAYLLYDQRAELSDTGVLVVGPSNRFLRYIAGVLPSLGESGVVSAVPADLYPGVRRDHPDDDATRRVKGRAEMADLLANALADRRRCPTEPLVVRYGATRARIPVDELRRWFARAQRYPTHNEGAEVFRSLVIDGLCLAVFDPSFRNRDDALATFERSREVRRFLLAHWPPLTPEQALNDLFGSRALLHSAARSTGLGRADRALLFRPRTSEAELDDRRWSTADLPLLDELLDLVGTTETGAASVDDIVRRDAADFFELSDDEDADDDTARLRAPVAVAATDDAVDLDDYDLDELLDGEPEQDVPISLDDPLFTDLGSDGSEYRNEERPTTEDDRFHYG